MIPSSRNKLLEPRAVIPTVLSLALLAAAASLSDIGEALDRILSIPPSVVAITLGLAAAYLALKALQFRVLLERLGVRPTWRQAALAFSIGELALNLPVGVFAQNYVLLKTMGARFSRSSGATMAMLVFEGTVALVTVLVIGVPGWTWVRPAVAAVFAAGGGAIAAFVLVPGLGRGVTGWLERGRLRKAGAGLVRIVAGVRDLVRPRPAVFGIALSLAYLASVAAAFLFVARGVGARDLSFLGAARIYSFALAVMLCMGFVLTQFGVIEASGMGAAHALGHPWTLALAMLLGFRLLWMGCIWAVCGPVVLLLRKELGK